MTYDLLTIPCLDDNYAYILRDHATQETLIVDVPDAAPLLDELRRRNWTATHVLLTHHHWDHVDGLPAFLAQNPAKVLGAAADAHRLPPLDIALSEGDTFSIGTLDGQVFDVSGHTIGHIAVHFPAAKALFTADSLMAMGCGRLFEGTGEQMHSSLQKLVGFAPETLVCSGHEYTQSNARFALSIEPNNPDLITRAAAINAARAKGAATVPSTLAEELATNPFLRTHSAEIRTTLGMLDAPDTVVFTEIRARKDRF